MPVRIRYDAQARIAHVTVGDPVSLPELAEALARLSSSDEYPPDVDAIWDGRAVDFSTIDRAFNEQMVKLRAAFPARRGARVAFVTPDVLGFGMARMFEMMVGEGNTRVCQSVDEAREWILAERGD